jgi:hydrogenase-4 component F
MALILIIIVPLLAALATLTVRRNLFSIQLIALVVLPAEVGAVGLSVYRVYHQSRYECGAFLAVDALGIIFLLAVATVGCGVILYSIGYLQEEVRKQIIGFSRVKQYFILLHLFLMAMFIAIITTNPILMWIALEATTLATAFLISFYNKPTSMEAAWKYLIINSVGLLLGFFFGTLLYLSPLIGSHADVSVSWQMLLANASVFDPQILKIAFVFTLIGYGTKAGLVPMHTWLPDAHSKAPSPISALLSGGLLNVALLAILRLKIITDTAIGPSFSSGLLIFFGVASIMVSAFMMLQQKNYKRLFAYSSIEHIGIITLGFGFGGLGTFAALLHMIYHALTKSVLFLTAGNILLKCGSTKIARIKGAFSVLPVTGVILSLGFLAITGVPPFGLFITELYILAAGIKSNLMVVCLVLLMLALAFISFLRHTMKMCFGSPVEPTPRGELGKLVILAPIILLSILLLISIFLPSPLRALIESAASTIQR